MRYLGKQPPRLTAIKPMPIHHGKQIILGSCKYEVRNNSRGWFLNSMTPGKSNDHIFIELQVNQYNWCRQNGFKINESGVFPYLSKEDLEKAIPLLEFQLLKKKLDIKQ